MAEVYKAVFVCEATKERHIWYVSSRHEARKMLRKHTHRDWCGRAQEKLYKENGYTYTVTPQFGDSNDVGYDSTMMGWGGT